MEIQYIGQIYNTQIAGISFFRYIRKVYCPIFIFKLFDWIIYHEKKKIELLHISTISPFKQWKV
jgi:hypothetical protein